MLPNNGNHTLISSAKVIKHVFLMETLGLSVLAKELAAKVPT